MQKCNFSEPCFRLKDGTARFRPAEMEASLSGSVVLPLSSVHTLRHTHVLCELYLMHDLRRVVVDFDLFSLSLSFLSCVLSPSALSVLMLVELAMSMT
eukprot:COSAG02_NODE_5836_length_4001_cov_5.624552_1_plen_98_part_00